ncbi:MAG TPA: hypothetical protein VF290_23330 [Pyrinomonadaceae bacterium]
METDDRSLLDEWISKWSEVFTVISSQDAAEKTRTLTAS